MWNKILLCACMLLLMEYVLANPYDLENCDTLNLGFIDVPSTSTITVRAGVQNIAVPTPCSIKFRAKDAEHVVKVSVVFLRLTDCTVNIIFKYGSQSNYYKCGDVNPGEIYTNQREVTIEMTKTGASATYSVEFRLSTVKPVITVPGDNSSPTQVGLIIGIVGGVFLFLLFIAILAVCCHKRAQRNKALYGQKYPTKKGLDDHEPRHVVGYTNDVVSNGLSPEESPRAKTKLLSEPDGGQESPRSKRPRNLNFSRTGQMSIKEMHTSPKKSTASYDFDKEDDDDPYDKMDDRQRPPKSPFLGALHSNAKFRRSFAENERDAEDRANRMSTGSSLGSSGASLDAPPLPSVPNVPKSPGSKKKNHASIRRNPRPTSSSEEEFNQINGDHNIRVIRDNERPSPSEFVPIQTQDPHQKADTRHTLRPNKGKSVTDKGKDPSNKKERRLEDFEPNSGNQNGNFQKNTARSSKRAQKSPRLGSNSQGFSHRRGRSVGDDGSRPGTPTSMVDLESLPPLQRSASRQSLYASRSSLYRRRGRRDSYAESVITCRDDISIGRHSRSYSQNYDDDEDFDGYEKPISRREKERMFRSLGDLGRETKERSTQTLRETATQTGHEQSVIMQPKRVVQRKKRSKSLSAVGTQTSKEKDTSKTREKKEDKGKNDGDKKENKVKSSNDKNNKEEAKEKEVTGKPKPKPKPKPRKSQGSVSAVAQSEDSDDGGKRKKKKKKKEKPAENDTSVGTSHPDRPPMVPQSQLPGQNVVMQDPVTGQFIQYPPGTIPPQQMVPGGYPAMVQPGYPMGVPQQPGTLPYNQVPQGYIAPGQHIPPQQPAHIPGKPRKSNWEMLCEMTDGDPGKRPAAVSDATSVVSSVFTSNVPSQPGYLHHPYANNAGAHPSNVIMPQTETLPRVPPTYTEVIGADAYSGPPSGPPSGIHNYSNSGSASLSGSDTGPPVHIVHNDTANLLPKKSSWEVLQEITDRQKAGESMV